MRKAAKAMMVAGGVLAVTTATLVGTGIASAHSGARNTDALVSKLAQKFGLNEADVKVVFDEERAAREADMKEKMEERLTQSVADGKITEEQKSQILIKLDELQAFRDSLEGKTEDEKREAMKAKMEEVRTWAEENNIPKRYFMMRGGHGHGRHHDMMNDAS